MTRLTRLNLTLALALALPLIFAVGCDSATVSPDTQEETAQQNPGAPAAHHAATRSTVPVITFATEEEVGTSRLTRTDNAIATRTNTTELVHRHVTTLWWVIFNNPDECTDNCGNDDLFEPTAAQPSCPYADGSIVGGNGNARFQDRLTVGEDRNSCLEFFGAEDHGLLNPEGAEVHVVVRSHGPLIPGMVPEMRSTFNGGCNEGEPNEGLCEDVQFAVHTPPE